MAPLASATLQTILLVLGCRTGHSRTGPVAPRNGDEKQREVDEPDITIVEAEVSEKTDLYYEMDPPPYEGTEAHIIVRNTARSRLGIRSIIQEKPRSPFIGTRVTEKAIVDPRDEEAARLAEDEEEDVCMLKGSSNRSMGREEQSRRPSRLGRLTSKFGIGKKGQKL